MTSFLFLDSRNSVDSLKGSQPGSVYPYTLARVQMEGAYGDGVPDLVKRFVVYFYRHIR